MRLLFTSVIVWAAVTYVKSETCFPKKFSSSSVVCTCDSTNCGDLGPLTPENGKVVSYRSSMDGERFQRNTIEFSTTAPNDAADITINIKNNTLQEILGFGGTFTDAAAINWGSVSEDLQKRLIQSYYGPDGLEYNLGRVSMGACDASARDYSYDETPGDFELKNFALATEDLRYKIPMLRSAKNVSSEDIYLYGSSWSAPSWMKSSGKTYLMGRMKGSPGDEYYKTWANYFVKFYEAYKEQGVTMWGFTVQNEPTNGLVPMPWQAMGLTPDTERDFLKLDLGPALFNATGGNIKIMVLDDSRFVLPWWANVIFSDPEASSYAAGIAVHWYTDSTRSSSVLDMTHQAHPDKFILATEASEPFKPPILGSWERAESYAQDIIDDLRHSVNGWTDWTLCVDAQGGPNWAKNFLDAPIVLDTNKQAFYKQPRYYALGHFSKLLPRGSVRLDDDLDDSQKNILAVTFLRPDKLKATVVVNQNDSAKKVLIKNVDGKSFVVEAGARSIVSTLW